MLGYAALGVAAFGAYRGRAALSLAGSGLLSAGRSAWAGNFKMAGMKAMGAFRGLGMNAYNYGRATVFAGRNFGLGHAARYALGMDTGAAGQLYTKRGMGGLRKAGAALRGLRGGAPIAHLQWGGNRFASLAAGGVME